jgi:hypothetical protein
VDQTPEGGSSISGYPSAYLVRRSPTGLAVAFGPQTWCAKRGSKKAHHYAATLLASWALVGFVVAVIWWLATYAPPSILTQHRERNGDVPGRSIPDCEVVSRRGKQRRYRTILSGVPAGVRRLSTNAAAFDMRTQPCDTASPSSHGIDVPWRPTTPPPGHSESFE